MTVLRRPLYVLALVFFFTVWILIGTDERYGLTAAMVAAPLLLLILLVPSLRRITVLLVAVLSILLASVVVYTRYVTVVQPLENLNNTTAESRLRITALPEGTSSLYRATVVESDTLPVGTKLCVSFADPDFFCEQYDEVNGTLDLYTASAQQQYLHGENVFLMGYFEKDPKVTDGEGAWYETIVRALRDKMIGNMHAVLPDASGDLLAGVCLGETSSFSEELQTDFQRSGLTHILVVSGLHMTVLTGALYKILRLLKAGRGTTLFITLLFLWVFMLMVGFTSSVIRSSVILHFLLIGQSLRIRADTRTSLAIALLLILLQNPYAAQDVGFVLSFASTLGLVVLNPVVGRVADKVAVLRKFELLKTGVLALCMPLTVMVFTAPILAYTFGTLPLLSPVANILTGVPVAALLYLGMIGAILYCIPGISLIAELLLFAAGLLAKWVMWVANVIADIPASQLQIRHGIILLLLFLVPAMLYWSAKLLKKRGFIRAAVASVVLIAVCCSTLSVFSRRMAFIRVFAQENALVMTVESNGQTVALMSGKDHYGYLAISRFLVSCGLQTIDTLVLMDGDVALTGSLAQLTETVPVKTVIYPRQNVDMTAGIGNIQRQSVQGSASITLCDTMRVELQGGWWRLTVGDTWLLVAPEKGYVRSLPEDWRQAHLTVFREEVPEAVSLLTTQRAVMVCTPQRVRYVTGELPWGRYPIDLTAQCGEIAFCTTKEGNITKADRYFL